MNIISLLELIKNQIDYSTFMRIQNDFMDDFSEEYRKLKPCKSTAEKAIKRYVQNAKYKDIDKHGIYSTGPTVLMLSADIPEGENLEGIELAEKVIEMWKGKRPTTCEFFDCIALYKALKKQETGDYLLHIDGYYYNIALVAEMIECIATKKDQYIRADICENGALFITQSKGTSAALILPMIYKSCSPSRNVNMLDFLKYCKDIEKSLIENIRKSA